MTNAARTIFDQEVLPLFEQNRAQWLAAARAAAEKLGREQTTVSIDDVRAVCPPPANIDPRVNGAIFNSKRWELVGYRQSDRKTCHGRPIGVFRLKLQTGKETA